jgi:large subunit ribosomal protein L4e
MKLKVYDLTGKAVDEVQMPFSEDVRDDLIRRAVLSEESREFQPKGSYRWAGLETSAMYVGRKEAYATLKNRGQAKLPREFYGGGSPGRVRRIPSSVKGRRAHPPKPEKVLIENMNKKEWLKAAKSALSASLDLESVKKRGHKINEKYPAVLIDDFESLNKTKEIIKVLNFFISEDMKRAKDNKQKITGIRRRTRSVRYPKSALIIASKGSAVLKAARNIAGIDTTDPKDLKVKNLAPGSLPGRPIIITRKALVELETLWGAKK